MYFASAFQSEGRTDSNESVSSPGPPTMEEYRGAERTSIQEGGRRVRAGASEKESPLLSVVTPVYNAADTLEATIRSVVSQSGANVEYLIVDGGSTDGTLDLIGRHDESVDYWMSGPDEGIYDAMNRGIARCRGVLVGILNADDVYHPDALSQVLRAHEHVPEADVIHGDLRIEMEGLAPQHYSGPDPLTTEAFRHGMPLNHPATFVRREAYEQYGLFDTRYRLAADAELMLRFLTSGARFHHIPAVLTHMEAGGASMQRACEARREVHDAFCRIDPPIQDRLLSFLDVLLKCIVTKVHRGLHRRSATRSVLQLYRVAKTFLSQSFQQ